VAATLDNIALTGVRDFTLTQPGLDATQCDTLLALLSEHERKALPNYEEGTRAEYIIARNTIDALQHGRMSAEQLADVLRACPTLRSSSGEFQADLARIEQHVRQGDWAAEIAACNSAFAAALAMKTVAYDPRRIRQFEDAHDATWKSQNLSVMPVLMSNVDLLWRACFQVPARRGATKCLIAARRYQLIHGKLPPDLAAAMREAKVRAVPIDPYCGRAMQYKVVDDKPVVYCVGEDGKDDGGEVEWNNDQWTGDLIFRIRE
jgi:hypothetical protein